MRIIIRFVLVLAFAFGIAESAPTTFGTSLPTNLFSCIRSQSLPVVDPETGSSPASSHRRHYQQRITDCRLFMIRRDEAWSQQDGKRTMAKILAIAGTAVIPVGIIGGCLYSRHAWNKQNEQRKKHEMARQGSKTVSWRTG
jgi:hypothetical protein